jgi:hypothetical protein
LKKSTITIVRIFVVYKPFRFFLALGFLAFFFGSLIGIRFLYFYFFTHDASGHIQSLILASILLGMGFQAFALAFMADLLAVNRRLMEDVQYRIRVKENHRE